MNQAVQNEHIRTCELCLEKNRPTFLLTVIPNQEYERRVLERHFGFGFSFSVKDINCMCFPCWHSVKLFDDFCNLVERNHQLALNIKNEVDDTIGNYLALSLTEGEHESKPTGQQSDANGIPYYRPVEISGNDGLQTVAPSALPVFPSQSHIAQIEHVVIEEAHDVGVVVEKEQRFGIDDPQPIDAKVGDSQQDENNDKSSSDSDQDFTAYLPKRSKKKPAAKVKSTEPKGPIRRRKRKPKPPSERTGQAREPYMCELCGYTSNSKTAYDNHHEMNHENNVYQCHLCSDRFRSKHSITVHMRRIHVKNIKANMVECDICGRRLNARCLERHKEIHDKDSINRYKCFECGRGFRLKTKLKEHETIHTGELPLKCSQCEMRFRFSSSLALHRKKAHSSVPGPSSQ